MNQADPSEEGPQSWRDWLPIRQLSEQEWQEYQSKKAADFQARSEDALALMTNTHIYFMHCMKLVLDCRIDRVTKPKEPPDTQSR